MSDSKIHLELSSEEALVFFEWLCRFDEAAHSTFEDQAEQRVLWNIQAQLESTLVEPFEPNYHETLTKARAKVRDSDQ